jgi:hypothetical protein
LQEIIFQNPPPPPQKLNGRPLSCYASSLAMDADHYIVADGFYHLNFGTVVARVGRYFDILIYRDILNRDYHIEGRNLSDDI